MHCPHCGKPLAQSSRVCAACGGEIDETDLGRPLGRTLMGGARPSAEAKLPKPPENVGLGGGTVIGIAPPVGERGGADKNGAARTKIGFLTPVTAAKEEAQRSGGSPREQRAASEEREPDRAYEHELGATMTEKLAKPYSPAKWLKVHALHIPRPMPPVEQRRAMYEKAAKKQDARRSTRKRMRFVYGAAGGLLFLALALGTWWITRFSRSPLRARAVTDAQGRESVELRCDSCPDGTQLRLGQTAGSVLDGVLVMPLEGSLLIGENRLKIFIDRPGAQKDETAFARLILPYRIHSNIDALQGDRPMLKVIVEAMAGTRVVLDGRPVPLVSGKAIEQFDVSELCTGQSAEIKPLNRHISYVITPGGGDAQSGSLNMVVSIVPLELDAPGTNVIIDGASFVLAGRTLKGAEILAAGRPIPMKPDGSFAHVMNVSSVGATQIEVRAKLSSMAPRIVRIPVRRVDSLETAARDFSAQNPISYAALGPDISKSLGQSIIAAGKVIDVKAEGYRTVARLDLNPSLGCTSCEAELLIGAPNAVKTGDLITAYGRVSGTARAQNGAPIPVLSIDFTLKGVR